MRIGVDVGGTNTDAVLMDGTEVKAWHKAQTSADVSTGISQAITAVLTESSVSPSEITCTMIGTTHFTNAFVERKKLMPVGVIRVGLPSARSLPPMIDWPHDLKAKVGDCVHLVHGGHQYDGRENAPFDEDEVYRAIKNIKSKGLQTIAVSSIFSPVNSSMEERVEEMLRNEIPDCAISLSSRIGRLGLIERENAAIMNASLASLSTHVVSSFKKALSELSITAPFYISQNDGTLMTAELVEQYPVLTFASGPTNSMRGAAYLSGLDNALVADIGGTTTDIGMLVNGFPRESSVTVDIGNVRTNFRMPDVFAIGLGGGSIVRDGDTPTVGPDSVGYKLTKESKIFGGSTLTTSDIAVAAGYADMGDPTLVKDLDPAFVDSVVRAIHTKLENAIDKMKTSSEDLPVILVGGGSVLINRGIEGASEIITPNYAPVANAIGASIAQVGGEVDRVYSYSDVGRDAALAEAKAEAVQQAVDAGASRESVNIVDIEELPLQYVPGGAVRVRVKAAGDLSFV